ncbi:mitochondrial carrier family, partial [Micromonas pusilla CCMP1545]
PRAQPRLQLLAGGFAGACAKTLVAPLDRARTIIQDTGWCGQRGSRKTVMGVCAKVFRGEGVAGLFRGNAVSVMKVLPCNALQFAIFNGLKEHTAGDKYSLTLAERLASGGVAGAVSTAACYPLDALKSQMAVSGGLRGGVVAAAKQLYLEQGGIRAFYKGLGPTLVADVVGTALGFTLYDTLTAAYRERCVGGRKATPFEKGVLGGVGACCSMTVTMPLEVVMTRMRVQGIGGRPVLYGSALECLRSIARKEGISSLWLGTTAAYVKIFPQLAATYFLFELAS